jgi:hypothetical protein
MKNKISYSSKVLKHAVKLVYKQQKEHGSQCSSPGTVAGKPRRQGSINDPKSARLKALR